jgi:hypothetical protein
MNETLNAAYGRRHNVSNGITRMKRLELTGKRFGRLVVIREKGSRINGSYWLCKCDCGGYKTIKGADLKIGHTRSCGCVRRESTAIRGKANITHGHRRSNGCSTTYRSWTMMRNRCVNKTNPNYPNYGGRGIKVCKRWNRFLTFLADMGPRPKGTTIDRINNDGDYKPSNCRWATSSQQNSNQRRQKRTKASLRTRS